ncbi:MAG: Hsp20/alpha crystallin family protein [Gemmatimonadetes bacterium]|nr:Hsp20/alpha crystallin family protein [Phycisphaerales bacterium]MCA9752686.1 Hsp20/alpha crystallin family protein [Gemmatimonadota bacterium]
MLVRRDAGLVPRSSSLDIDRLFRDVFEDFPTWAPAAWSGTSKYPAVNAWEDDHAYHVEAELAGFQEKDIEITVLGNELRISGRREEKTEENAKVYHRERYVGEFSRVLRFPVDLDDSKVEAKLDHGVLRVRLPKAAAALPRKIEVQG